MTVMALVIGLLWASPSGYAADPPVDLGTAGADSVLGGQTVTNTGASVLWGDLGVSPGTTITGFPPGTVDGTTHAGDATAAQAQVDLTAAYNDAAGRTPVTTVATELGGTTLNAGVYDSAAGTFQITGTLTLDAQGDANALFVFRIGSTFTTAAAGNTVLIGEAQSCQVFWQIGSSATLGAGSSLDGTMMAQTSITVGAGSTIRGRALARDGSVTLDSDTFLVPACALAPTTTTTSEPPTTTTTSEPPTTTTTSEPPTTTTTAVPAEVATTTTSPGVTGTTTLPGGSTTTTTRFSTTSTESGRPGDPPLPNTGAGNLLPVLIAGAALLALGSGFYVTSRT